MKHVAMLISLFAIVSSLALGAETLRTFSWSQLKEQGALTKGAILPPGGGSAVERLQVDNPGPGPMTVEVLAVDSPGITEATYALKGYIRCQDVEGEAYLEMWNHMPDREAFFSRTLADSGPMARLSGNCERRRFIVPAYLTTNSGRPTRLTLSVVLPGKGAVVLDSLELAQFTPSENPLLEAQSDLWAERSGAMIGAIVGALFGLIGAVVGILGARHKAHKAVLGIMAAMTVLAVVMLLGGLTAMSAKQPSGLWYPLVLGGVIGVVVFGGLIPVVRRRQRQEELRRMEAMDAS